MALIEKELKIERETLPFRLPKDLATKVGLYARFLDSSRDYVVTRILEYVIGRDREFAAWLKNNAADGAQAPASIDTARRHAGRPRTVAVQTSSGAAAIKSFRTPTEEAHDVPAHR
jgi:hypothetical protein